MSNQLCDSAIIRSIEFSYFMYYFIIIISFIPLNFVFVSWLDLKKLLMRVTITVTLTSDFFRH